MTDDESTGLYFKLYHFVNWFAWIPATICCILFLMSFLEGSKGTPEELQAIAKEIEEKEVKLEVNKYLLPLKREALVRYGKGSSSDITIMQAETDLLEVELEKLRRRQDRLEGKNPLVFWR